MKGSRALAGTVGTGEHTLTEPGATIKILTGYTRLTLPKGPRQKVNLWNLDQMWSIGQPKGWRWTTERSRVTPIRIGFIDFQGARLWFEFILTRMGGKFSPESSARLPWGLASYSLHAWGFIQHGWHARLMRPEHPQGTIRSMQFALQQPSQTTPFS